VAELKIRPGNRTISYTQLAEIPYVQVAQQNNFHSPCQSVLLNLSRSLLNLQG